MKFSELSKLKNKELKYILKQNKIIFYFVMNKAELLEKMEEIYIQKGRRNAVAEPPGPGPYPSPSPSPQKQSLPDGWVELKDKNGKSYFWNKKNNTTQWEFPGLNISRNNISLPFQSADDPVSAQGQLQSGHAAVPHATAQGKLPSGHAAVPHATAQGQLPSGHAAAPHATAQGKLPSGNAAARHANELKKTMKEFRNRRPKNNAAWRDK